MKYDLIKLPLLILGIALFFVSKGIPTFAALPQNPGWWNPQTATSCDQTNYQNNSLGKNWGGGTNTSPVTPYTLSSTNYSGLYGCGPRPNYDNNAPLADPQVHFYSGATTESDFECVELVMRYLYLQYGVSPYPANGNQVVSNYNTSYGGGLSVINNGTSGQAPQPGDVISFGSSTPGHTALVISSNVNGSGNGSITVLQQNAPTPTQNLNVSSWTVAAVGSGLNATGWLHKPASAGNISVASTPTVNTNPVRIGQSFSAVFTVSNTGDLPFNLNQLILSVRDPNGVTHQVVGDNNSTPLAGHSSRTFTPYNNVTSFGDSTWPSGQYSIDPQYMDTNNNFQDISNSYPKTFTISPAQLSITSGITINNSQVVLRSPFSGSFVVTNTGGVQYNLNQLDLMAAGPNSSSYDIYGDNNNQPILAGTSRTLTITTANVPSFGAGCSTCTPGSYTFIARVFDTGGHPSNLGNTNPTNVNTYIAPETGSQAMIGDDTYVDTASVGTDNNIYRNAHSATTQSGWMGYGAMSSGIHFVGKPSYAQTAQGYLSIIGRDNTGIVYQISETSMNPANWTSWSAFTAGSFHAAGDILQSMQPNQVFALFGVGTDGNIWWNQLNSPAWNAVSTKPTGVTFTGKPSTQTDINGLMELYARDTNGNMWQNHEDTSTTWHGWYELNQIGSGGTLTLVGDPMTMLHSNGLISVYGIGSDGNLYVAGQGLSGGNLVWYNWGELPVNTGVTLTGDLTTILDPNNVMEVVTKDTNGNIWDIYQANTSSYWSNWTKYSNSGFVAKGDPFMVQHLDNTEEIFCLGIDNMMWHMWSSGSGGSAVWSNWYSLGGSLTQ